MHVSKLSVVVPVYNGEATLALCLDALVAALPEGAELIVVNDGSTDGTAALVERSSAMALHNTQNLGTSASRNRGWRASSGDLVAFVDADVQVPVDALERLVQVLEERPELQGVNALLSLDCPAPGVVSAFANTSIHYQHLQHGASVNTAFTSLCVLRRATLERIGGWDERWSSRYADDVVTRFLLPEDALAMEHTVQVKHHKQVPFRGLLKHRFNVGKHFVASVVAHRRSLADDPRQAVLAARFPLNTLAGAGYLVGGAMALTGRPLGWVVLGGSAGVTVAANARFLLFTARHRGVAEAAAALPLSAFEGIACCLGVSWGGAVQLRRRLKGRSPDRIEPEPAVRST